MPLTLRSVKGAPLTNAELDENFRHLEFEADAARAAQASAEQSAADAAAVVTGGTATLDPAPGKIPLARATGAIDQAWVTDLPFALDALRTATQRALHGDGPYPSLDLQFAGATRLDPRVTFTRASTATCFGATGKLVTVAANQPRFDYDPVTGESRGLLIEESRTNLLRHSNNFTSSVWVASGGGVALTSGVLDPSGALTAITVTATGDALVLQQSPVISIGDAVAGSIWIRRRAGSGEIGIRVAENTNIPITVTSQWARVSASSTATSTIGRFGIHIANSGDAVDIWSAQLELGTGPSSYIPTEASQVTRAADVAAINDISSWYRQDEGTLLVSYRLGETLINTRAASLCNNANTDLLDIVSGSGSGIGGYAHILVEGAGQASVPATTPAAPFQENRVAVAYRENDIAGCRNGGVVGVDSSAQLPVPTKLTLGHNRVGWGQLGGHLKRITYYPHRLTDAQIQTLTT